MKYFSTKYLRVRYLAYGWRNVLFTLVLLADFLIHPKHFRYWRMQKKWSTRPPLPWFTFSAIDWLTEQLTQDTHIFEWGSGGSTLFFASRVAHLVSIESDPEWYKNISEEINQEGFHIDYRLVGSPAYAATIDSFPDEHFDIISIDGIDRNECIRKAILKLKKGGAILLDNSERSEYSEGLALLSCWKTTEYYGPGLYNRYPWKTSLFIKPNLPL